MPKLLVSELKSGGDNGHNEHPLNFCSAPLRSMTDVVSWINRDKMTPLERSLKLSGDE